YHRYERVNFAVRESVGAGCRERHGLVRAIGKRHREHYVIGDALPTQVFENRKLAVIGRGGQLAAHWFAIIRNFNWAVFKYPGLTAVRTIETLGRTLAELPQPTE